jgi:PleD family two-component response regulator
VTLSAGIVEIQPDETPRAAIARADAKLYQAKSTGRNRVKTGQD